MPSKDVQNVGIEFGDWKLVPLDNLNWELCHRHASTRGSDKGTVRWHRLGKYYQHDTVGNAMLFAADHELKQGCKESAMTMAEAAEKWEATLRDFREGLSEARETAN